MTTPRASYSILRALLAPTLLALAAGASLAAEEQPAAPRVGEEYVEKLLECRRLEAAAALVERENERLTALGEAGSPAQAFLDRLSTVDPAARQALGVVLTENGRPALQDLKEATEKLDEQIGGLTDSWKGVRTALADGQDLLFRVRASGRVAGQLASLLSVDNRWFYLFALIAVVGLIGLVFHDRRHELRKTLQGGKARSLGLSTALMVAAVVLLVMVVAIFAMGDRIYEAMLTATSNDEVSPRKALETQLEEVEQDRATLAAKCRKLERTRSDLEAAVEKKIAAVNQETLGAAWKDFRHATVGLAERVAVLEQLGKALEADQTALDKLNEELSAQAEQTARYLRIRQWVRGLLGAILLAAVAVGGALYLRSAKKRRTRIANTCPNCMMPIPPAPPAKNGEMEGSRVVHCPNFFTRSPEVACNYVFRELYRPIPKVCFPTMGIPQAGKTHWLTMLYREVNLGNYDSAVEFQRIKRVESDVGIDYDDMVTMLLAERMSPEATQRDRVPVPLVFNFTDRDRLGRSNVLVNVFDYSGEVTRSMDLDDYQRRRALNADGFFFFLDPTFPIEPQAKCLADFRSDLREVKGVQSGALRIPLALCVSKIDLLGQQRYASPDGGDPIERFYARLKEIDPTGKDMSAPVIEARSRAVAELRDTIWPGWQIERLMDDLFGGRHMFFPLTPVGMAGAPKLNFEDPEFSMSDSMIAPGLDQVAVSPFGLLEPLLWLLEMNGFRVLRKRKQTVVASA